MKVEKFFDEECGVEERLDHDVVASVALISKLD